MESLQEWFMNNMPDDNMRYKESFNYQVMDVRDKIPAILRRFERMCSDDNYHLNKDMVKVRGTHTSKSITLPVYFIKWHDIEFTIRGNFHDWKVSVNSPVPLEIDFEDIFKDQTIGDIYCEGFYKEWVYSSFYDNNKQFTVELCWESMVMFFRKIWYYIRMQEEKERPFISIVEEILDTATPQMLSIQGIYDTFEDNLKGLIKRAKESRNKLKWNPMLDTYLNLFLKLWRNRPDMNKFPEGEEDLETTNKIFRIAYTKTPFWLEEINVNGLHDKESNEYKRFKK
jgi:hypothetical protein